MAIELTKAITDLFPCVVEMATTILINNNESIDITRSEVLSRLDIKRDEFGDYVIMVSHANRYLYVCMVGARYTLD